MITIEDRQAVLEKHYRRMKRLLMKTEKKLIEAPTEELRKQADELRGYLRAMTYMDNLLWQCRNANQLPLEVAP